MWQVYYIDRYGLPKTINGQFEDKYLAILAVMIKLKKDKNLAVILSDAVPDDATSYFNELFDFALIKK